MRREEDRAARERRVGRAFEEARRRSDLESLCWREHSSWRDIANPTLNGRPGDAENSHRPGISWPGDNFSGAAGLGDLPPAPWAVGSEPVAPGMEPAGRAGAAGCTVGPGPAHPPPVPRCGGIFLLCNCEYTLMCVRSVRACACCLRRTPGGPGSASPSRLGSCV